MTFRHISALLTAVILLVGGKAVYGEEAESSSETWEDKAHKSGLSESDISALEKNRILITDEAYKQIFSVYLTSGSNSLFITSDSLLNAFHVLYQESVLRLESTKTSQLIEILKFVLNNLEDIDKQLKGKPALVSAAKDRAKLVMGIALRLMDDSFRFKDEKLDAILDQETKKIVRAEAVEMPKWLGKPNASFAALDYTRYKPRGIYTRSEQLKRYYRAVSWLQSIPFRVSEDEELLAILMLGNSVTYNRFDNYEQFGEIEQFFRAYSVFIGSGDDWDIITAAHEAQNELRMNLNGDDLQDERESLIRKAKNYDEDSIINDQIRFAPDDPKMVAEPNFRIISAYRTPGAILFQRTTDLRQFKRSYPNGLEIPIILGSTFARKSLKDSKKEDLLKTIDSCQPFFEGRSLYYQYMDALRALLDEPESDAPDFMKNEAWQTKSCNTVLAGWAQLRHTWMLQAKRTVHYLCAIMVPDGFVEPEPEFFSRMADLADTTKYFLKESGAFDPDYEELIANLKKLKSIIQEMDEGEKLIPKLMKLPFEEAITLELPYILMDSIPSKAESGSKEYFVEKAKCIDTIIADIEDGRIGKHPGMEELIKEYLFDLEEMWERFEKVCLRLESIANKQLRGADLNESEINFIETYGETIAGIMSFHTIGEVETLDVEFSFNMENGIINFNGVDQEEETVPVVPSQSKNKYYNRR